MAANNVPALLNVTSVVAALTAAVAEKEYAFPASKFLATKAAE